MTGCNALREEGSQSLGGRGLRNVSCWVKGPLVPLPCLVAPFFLLFLGSFEQKAVQALCGSSPLPPAGTAAEPIQKSLHAQEETTAHELLYLPPIPSNKCFSMFGPCQCTPRWFLAAPGVSIAPPARGRWEEARR